MSGAEFNVGGSEGRTLSQPCPRCRAQCKRLRGDKAQISLGRCLVKRHGGRSVRIEINGKCVVKCLVRCDQGTRPDTTRRHDAYTCIHTCMYQHGHVGRSGFSDTTLCAFLFRLAVLCHNIEMNNDSCLVKLPPRSAPSASRASLVPSFH